MTECLIESRVMDEAVAGGIESAQAAPEVLSNDRSRQGPGEIAGVQVAELGSGLHLQVRSRFLRDVLDRPANIVSAIKRALRALQNLDAFEILGTDCLAFKLLHVVDVEAHSLNYAE